MSTQDEKSNILSLNTSLDSLGLTPEADFVAGNNPVGCTSLVYKKEIDYFISIRDERTLLENKHIAILNKSSDILPFIRLKLSIVQINLIIITAKRPVSMIEIVKSHGGLYPQLITKPINSLIKMGILYRFKKQDNKKNVYVDLTDYGRKLFEEQNNLRLHLLCEKFSSVASIDEIKKLQEHHEYYNNILRRLEDSV